MRIIYNNIDFIEYYYLLQCTFAIECLKLKLVFAMLFIIYNVDKQIINEKQLYMLSIGACQSQC